MKIIETSTSYYQASSPEDRKKVYGILFFKHKHRHKIRLFFGVDGQMPGGRWFYSVPKYLPSGLRKVAYKFMYRIGDPLLNKIIGYEKL